MGHFVRARIDAHGSMRSRRFNGRGFKRGLGRWIAHSSTDLVAPKLAWASVLLLA